MTTETIKTASRQEWLEARTQDITSTEIPALFGASPYMTHFELWHRKKKGEIVEIEENERMKWGTRLQDSIAYGIADDNGLVIRRMDEYIRDADLKIGASFDFAVEDDGLLEIKNVDSLIFNQQWEEDEAGGIEAPLHIEFQIQHQLLVSGRKYAYLGVLVGGNKVFVIKKEPHKLAHDAIRNAVEKFWISIESGQEPKPDFEKDADFIRSLYPYADPNKIMDATEDMEELVHKYKEHGQLIKNHKAYQDACRAELITLMGDAEKVKGELFSISAGMVGPKRVEAFERKGYRVFRINTKKGF